MSSYPTPCPIGYTFQDIVLDNVHTVVGYDNGRYLVDDGSGPRPVHPDYVHAGERVNR